MKVRPRSRSLAVFAVAVLAGLMYLGLCVLPGRSQTEAQRPASPTLTLNGAVQLALARNPALATFRRNRGIAEAAVQIARQYPFNPIIQDYTWYGQGPPAAGVTNHVFNEHTARLDLEWRHQGRYRRGMAQAALTRTQWEIAAQELLVSITVIRAYNTLLYRQGKFRLLEEGVQLTEQVGESVQKLFDQGTLRSADLLLARADVAEARNLLGPGRSLLVVAENDLRRNLGLIVGTPELDGSLEKSYVPPPEQVLIPAALQRRPDLHALDFAVKEAENRLRLEIANRFGNPSLGPAFEENETSVSFVGMWLIWQAPVINTRKGEINQRRAEMARAAQALQQGEIQVQQDVVAGLARLRQAEAVVNSYATETLPELRKAREEYDKLYLANQPGVDLARIVEIRRRLLRARDAYLDALFELSQAQTDLAAAVADLSFAGCLDAPPSTESAQAAAPTTEAKPPAAPEGEQLPPPTPLPGK
jgi:outer membrane protein TolC